ncbi:sickle tail protein-like isoform X3 [Gadus macrocephalus]|uniref:sickle tail protein-like isoform X3 n=1 Tax=Gadus macrocephalus TaxID=80720 RepID=UPI0028CB8D13|nr:sickle tail protein-like isoform X3 [Gadus macrocephalus]
MKAMEQQIASLTGLVQHALLKGPNSGSTKETTSERPSMSSSPAQSINSTVSGGSPVLSVRNAPVQFDPALGLRSAPVQSDLVPGQRKAPVQAAEKSWRPLQVNLKSFRKNISDLRVQLQQMRQQQLQNQEELRQQLKWAEQEVGAKLAEALRRADEPAHRQRTLVEEDRLKYLGLEQDVLSQLGDLERYVDSLQRDQGGPPGRPVSLREVEEGAVSLRKVGEGLAGLKGEFPGLQGSMRTVLRVEVEAVKFLKEEPHKLDSMLKRVRSLTETLSSLRRYATEVSAHSAVRPAPGGPTSTLTTSSTTTTTSSTSTTLLAEPPREPPRESPCLAASSGQTEAEAAPLPAPRPPVKPPSSLMVVQHAQSSPVLIQHSQTSGSPQGVPADAPGPLTPKARAPEPARKPPGGGGGGGGLLNNGSGTRQDIIEELQTSQGRGRSRALSIEAAEKEWEERRQNMGQYDGKEFEKLLQEAEATMMKGAPVSPTASAGGEEPGHPASPATTPTDPKPDGAAEKQPRPGPERNDRPSRPAVLERPSKTPGPIPAHPAEKTPKTVSEKGCKSPPPPPPRKTYSGSIPGSGSGLTTTRSGEVVFTSKRSSGQEEEEDAPPPPSPKSTPFKVSPVATPTPVLADAPPKTATPPPHPEPITEGEDDGENIMAELQVFQKCPVGGVLVEPQVKELRAGALPALKEKTKQTSDPAKEKEDKSPDTDENGNTQSRQSPAVIYYVTGQITKEHPPSTTPEESTERSREFTFPPSQVSNVNANDHFPSQLPQSQTPPKPPPKPSARSPPVSPPAVSPPPTSPPSSSPPPISPKPVGLIGFKLPRKQMKRSVSLKSDRGAEVEKGNLILLNQINNEKKLKSSVVQETNSKSIMVESVSASTVETPRELPTVPLPETAPAQASDRARDPPKGRDEGAGLSPDLPGEEAPPPPDNIAFMITSSKVQALSCGEYKELVNSKKGNVQTLTVGESGKWGDLTGGEDADATGTRDYSFNKKPVIIIFDEPMDIRSAYKRLSTVFECEEEMERMLGEERIDEESEGSDSDRSGAQQVTGGAGSDVSLKARGQSLANRGSLSSCSSSSSAELADGAGNSNESNGEGKQDGKKKFRFKFPKKQLAALSQAIRTGSKSGKKTLQVVVYEDEEETDGTVRQHKEAKRFEILRTDENPVPVSTSVSVQRDTSDSLQRTSEIRKSTYKTLDSLEQTIKQLETTISEMGPCSPDEHKAEEKMGEKKSSEGLKRSASLPTSRMSGPKVTLPLKSSLRKKSKPQLLPRPVVAPTATSTPAPSSPASVKQQSLVSPTSRMPVPLSTKARQSPGNTEKPAKQPKLPDAQRQFRQGNGSAKRADHKAPSPSVSKIPAFYPSATKGTHAPNPDATNTNNPSSSSSSSSSSSNNKSSLPSPHHPPRSSSSSSSPSSSQLPSLSNGNPKLTPATPSQHAGKTLSLSSPQTQNIRVHSYSSSSSSYSSSSSSSPSPLSPTPLGPGGRSIRTIHTPSFTSYRSHNGSKSCIPTATKDSN